MARGWLRLSTVLLACAAVLLPWIVYLSLTLGSGDYLVRRWGVAWCGLDVAEVAGLVATGLLIRRRSHRTSMVAAATATLFLVDAWFDTVTARIGMDYLESLTTGLAAELPLGALLAVVAWRTAHWRPTARKRSATTGKRSATAGKREGVPPLPPAGG